MKTGPTYLNVYVKTRVVNIRFAKSNSGDQY